MRTGNIYAVTAKGDLPACELIEKGIVQRIDDKRTLVVTDLENLIISSIQRWGDKPDLECIDSYLSGRYNLIERVGFASISRMNGTKKILEKLGWNIQNVRTKNHYGNGNESIIKNGLDIELALFTLEYVLDYRPERVVLISGDGDYVSLVVRLRRRSIEVEAISVDNAISGVLKRNVDGYTSLEDIISHEEYEGRTHPDDPSDSYNQNDIGEPYTLLVQHIARKTAFTNPPFNASSIKTSLKKEHSDFNEKRWGFKKFHHLLESAQRIGLLNLEKNEKGYWVIPIEEFEETDAKDLLGQIA